MFARKEEKGGDKGARQGGNGDRRQETLGKRTKKTQLHKQPGKFFYKFFLKKEERRIDNAGEE